MISDADRKMETVVGQMLRIGVTIAALVVFAGWIIYLVEARGLAPDYRQFHGTPILLTQLHSIFHGVRAADSRSVIDLGLLLLIATPVVRVIFCIVGFGVQRDRLYVLVSSIVLAILLYSLFYRV